MSDTVKRYDFEGIILPYSLGDYVRYSDYEALRQQVAELDARLSACREFVEAHDRYWGSDAHDERRHNYFLDLLDKRDALAGDAKKE